MASIPVVVAEQMLKEGVDVYKAPIRDIVKWLKNNDMGHFLTTDKRI
jgi:predicted transcriptional regulator